MSHTGLKTGDLDLDIQGQIGLKTKKKILSFLVNATTFEPWNSTFKLELCIDHLMVLDHSKNL